MKNPRLDKQKELSSWIVWFCLPLLIIFGGAMSVYASQNLYHSMEARFRWNATTAQVISLERAGKGYAVEYRYQVDAVSYTGKDLFPLPKKSIGEEIAIRYDPNQPSHNKAVFFWAILLFVPLLFIVEICWIVAWVQQVRMRIKK